MRSTYVVVQWRVCLPCFGWHLSVECVFYFEAVLDTVLDMKAVAHPVVAAVVAAFVVPAAVVAVAVALVVVVAAAEAAAEFQVVLVSELGYFFVILVVGVWMQLLILEPEGWVPVWLDLPPHGGHLGAAMLQAEPCQSLLVRQPVLEALCVCCQHSQGSGLYV